MARCLLLELCQELRDIIYEFALTSDESKASGDGDGAPLSEQSEECNTRTGLESDGKGDQYGWHYHLPTESPTPTWLALMRCNRQLRDEVTDFLDRRDGKSGSPFAKMTVKLDHPTCTPTVISLRTRPQQIRSLDLTLDLTNLYAPSTLPPSQALAHATWRLLQRFVTHGPHLGRRDPLREPLKLQNLRISLAEPRERDLAFAYGNPWMQMHSHYSCLKWALGVFARAAESAGGEKGWSLGTTETRFRGKWESVYMPKDGTRRGIAEEGSGLASSMERDDSDRMRVM